MLYQSLGVLSYHWQLHLLDVYHCIFASTTGKSLGASQQGCVPMLARAPSRVGTSNFPIQVQVLNPIIDSSSILIFLMNLRTYCLLLQVLSLMLLLITLFFYLNF